MMCFLLMAILGVSTVFASPGVAVDEAPAVVRLINNAQRADANTPWNTRPVQRSSGSGLVIEGGRILTNAHVVADTRLLQIYLHGDPTPHEARVVAVAHDADVAVVAPLDEHLLDDIEPLTFGGLPAMGTPVVTLGYPAGGRRLSSTRGVVSRIEVQTYVHSGVFRHLAIQTDAAINPGNSGGPVLQDGKVVGLAFQGSRSLDNVGFFIPTEVVQHVLTDLEDGQYDGWAYLGVGVDNLENPAARARRGMPSDASGLLVYNTIPGGSADGVLQNGDVLLSMDGFDIANDGTVERFGLRLALQCVLDLRQVGDEMPLEVLRDGERLSLKMPLKIGTARERTRPIYDVLPRYVVYAGLVFVPLDRNGLDAAGRLTTPLRWETVLRPWEDPTYDKEESVLLLRRLDHPVNTQLAWFNKLVVEEINGVPIRKLDDVITAFEGNDADQHVMDFGYFGRFGVLDREASVTAHPQILQQYGVPEDRRL
ncbi:MAG: trypsin-like peptidase domain-containing protein [Myxococcota bacterium]